MQLQLYISCMVDVYYPFFQREAVWEELRYSLRSIEKHLKCDFRVVIVGDLPECIDLGKVLYIPHQRIEGVKENTLADAITKMLLYCNNPDAADTFIRMYDDIYLLNDVTLDDIAHPKMMYDLSEMPLQYGTWWGQLRRTLETLQAHHAPTMSYESHFPDLFNKEWMLYVLKEYDALERRLLITSLYFNSIGYFETALEYEEARGIQFYNDVDNRFYTSSGGNLEKKCAGKIYLNHNNSGLTQNLKSFLMNRFPTKSRFEK